MGVPIYNVVIDKPIGNKVSVYNNPYDYRQPHKLLESYYEIEPSVLSFSIPYTKTSYLLIESIKKHYYNNFVILSPSGVCQFCGSYYSAGTLKCSNCHGFVKDEIVSVKQSRFELLSTNYDNLMLEDYNKFITVDFSIDNDTLTNFIETLQITKNIGLPNSFNLQEEYIMCDCCLSIVKAKDKCPNCGGARLPFSEIIKIDRKCIFCGSKTYDGVLCKNCGASLSGLSYREYLNEFNTTNKCSLYQCT